MNILRNENPRPFDVDGTLILPHTGKGKTVNVIDPVTRKVIKFTVHEPMVRLLEEEFHRGSLIVVWSRGGFEWAAAVVNALGLSDKVHTAMTKPQVYFDDLPVEEWLKDRVFLDPTTRYKR